MPVAGCFSLSSLSKKSRAASMKNIKHEHCSFSANMNNKGNTGFGFREIVSDEVSKYMLSKSSSTAEGTGLKEMPDLFISLHNVQHMLLSDDPNPP